MTAHMETREFDVVLEPQPDGGYTVYVPELPGCASEGDTRTEALDMIKEAIELYLEPLPADRELRRPHVRREHARVSVAA